MMPPRALIALDELAAMLAARISSLASELLPNGHRHGTFWRTGSIADEAGESLAVNLSGPRVGNWCDFSGATPGHRQGGDALHLVAEVRFGGDLKEAIRWARSWLGLDDLDPRRLAVVKAEARVRREHAEQDERQRRESRRAKAQALWLAGVPIAGTPAELYLRGRGIDLRALGKAPGALRYHDDCWNAEIGAGSPAMVARVQDLAGRHVATHRTWIEPDGAGGWMKARLEEPKMCLGRFWGGHIPLWKGQAGDMPLARVPAATDVWIAEGIEDGLTVACAEPHARVVAAVTLGNIGEMAIPPQVETLVVIGQRDTKPQPIATLAEIMAARADDGWRVDLVLPPEGCKDFNELAQRRMREQAA